MTIILSGSLGSPKTLVLLNLNFFIIAIYSSFLSLFSYLLIFINIFLGLIFKLFILLLNFYYSVYRGLLMTFYFIYHALQFCDFWLVFVYPLLCSLFIRRVYIIYFSSLNSFLIVAQKSSSERYSLLKYFQIIILTHMLGLYTSLFLLIRQGEGWESCFV